MVVIFKRVLAFLREALAPPPPRRTGPLSPQEAADFFEEQYQTSLGYGQRHHAAGETDKAVSSYDRAFLCSLRMGFVAWSHGLGSPVPAFSEAVRITRLIRSQLPMYNHFPSFQWEWTSILCFLLEGRMEDGIVSLCRTTADWPTLDEEERRPFWGLLLRGSIIRAIHDGVLPAHWDEVVRYASARKDVKVRLELAQFVGYAKVWSSARANDMEGALAGVAEAERAFDEWREHSGSRHDMDLYLAAVIKCTFAEHPDWLARLTTPYVWRW